MSRRGPVELILALALLLPSGCVPLGEAPGPGVSRPAAGHSIAPSPGDEALAAAVRTRLAETDRAGFQGVSVLVWNGTVLLTGAVIRPEQGRRAGQAAREVPGVAEVHVELQCVEKEILGGFAPDPQRERAILDQIAARSDLSGSFTLRMVHGVVYLLGSAPSRAEAERAADVIRDIDGVKWVVDRVAVP